MLSIHQFINWRETTFIGKEINTFTEKKRQQYFTVIGALATKYGCQIIHLGFGKSFVSHGLACVSSLPSKLLPCLKNTVVQKWAWILHSQDRTCVLHMLHKLSCSLYSLEHMQNVVQGRCSNYFLFIYVLCISRILNEQNTLCISSLAHIFKIVFYMWK